MNTKKINFNWRLWLAILIAFLLLVDIVRADDSASSYGFTLDQLENDPQALEMYKTISGIPDVTITPGELALNIYHSVVSKVGAWSDTVVDTVDSWYDDFKNSISIGSDGFIRHGVDVSSNIKSRLENLQFTSLPGGPQGWDIITEMDYDKSYFTSTYNGTYQNYYSFIPKVGGVSPVYVCTVSSASNVSHTLVVACIDDNNSLQHTVSEQLFRRDGWSGSRITDLSLIDQGLSTVYNGSAHTVYYYRFSINNNFNGTYSTYTNHLWSSLGATSADTAVNVMLSRLGGSWSSGGEVFNHNAYVFDTPVTVSTPARNAYYTNYNNVNYNTYNSISNDDGLNVEPIVPVVNIPSFNLPTFSNPFPTVDYSVPFYLQPNYYDLTLPDPVERPQDIEIPYKFNDIDLDLPADYSNNSLFIQDAWEVLPSGMQDYVLACLGLSLCFLFLRRS